MPRELILTPLSEGLRLDHVLAGLFPEMGLRGRRRLCEDGRVYVDGRPAGAGFHVRSGQRISVTEDEALPPAVSIVCREAGLAALDKPAGLPSAHLAGRAATSLESSLGALFPDCLSPFPKLLNRLDTGTSGLVLAALSIEGLNAWQAAEAAMQVEKRYLAVVEGVFPCGEERVFAAALDMKQRRTTRLLDFSGPEERHTRVKGLGEIVSGRLSLVGCVIRRGARHQIRVHLAGAGFPLWGDAQYGSRFTGRPAGAAISSCGIGSRAFSACAAEGKNNDFVTGIPFGRGGAASRQLFLAPAAFFLHHGYCRAGGFCAGSLPPWLDSLPAAAAQAALNWLDCPKN